jgi:hypothetical protein
LTASPSHLTILPSRNKPYVLGDAMKPGDFFVGIVDFFAVLLPGAFLAITVRVFAHDRWLCKLVDVLNGLIHDERERWVAFLLASYVLGHLVFHGSARLDSTYNALYLKIKQGKNPLAWEKVRSLWVKLRPKRDRGPAEEERPKEQDKQDKARRSKKPDALYDKATELMETDDSISTDEVEALQWCSGFVRTHNAAAIALIDGYEASQKFFRSMVVVFAIYAILCDRGHYPNAALVFAGLTVLAYLRYCRLRWKMTQAAFLFYFQLRKGEVSKPKTRS